MDRSAALEPEDFVPHPPPGPTIPPPAEIHLWTIPLEPPPERVAALRLLLTPEETARADRFHFEHHRRRFTVGRGALRELLAAYLDGAPDDLHFVYGEKGKPFLDGPAAAGDDLRFNLSNSHELALVAVGVGHELGVDLEHAPADARRRADRRALLLARASGWIWRGCRRAAATRGSSTAGPARRPI